MLTAEQIREKIFRRADEFKEHARQKEWSRAKYAYDSASTMAVFMELPESDLAVLFGNRAYKEDDDPMERGLFDEELVHRAYWECILANQTLEVKPYPGNPNTTPDYDSDIWARQVGSGAAHSPYEIYGNGA